MERIKYDGPLAGPGGGQSPWLVYKFPSEILVPGSQLIVNESQEAIFFEGGNALDVFGPGTHTLSAGKLPLFQEFVHLPFGGKTPFTAEVYFVNKVSKLDMKWGTTSPFEVTDPRYHVIVSVRAFGRIGIKISDSRSFVSQIVGALRGGHVSDYETVSSYFNGLVVVKVKDTIADIIVNKQISIMDITASIDSISTICRERMEGEFDAFGIEVLNFFIESINFPQEDLTKLKELSWARAEFEILGDERYKCKRSFDVLDKEASSAENVIADATRQIEVDRCPNCGDLVNPGRKECARCGSVYLVTSLACLDSFDKSGVNKYINYYKPKLKESPDNGELNYAMGICYLDLGLHELASKYFAKAIEQIPDYGDVYYYCALALFRGKKPRVLTLTEIKKIEGYLSAAIQIDSSKAKYYYLWALIKYDFYIRNGLRVNPPTFEELISEAESKSYANNEIEKMLQCVPINDQDLIRLVRRS